MIRAFVSDSKHLPCCREKETPCQQPVEFHNDKKFETSVFARTLESFWQASINYMCPYLRKMTESMAQTGPEAIKKSGDCGMTIKGERGLIVRGQQSRLPQPKSPAWIAMCIEPGGSEVVRLLRSRMNGSACRGVHRRSVRRVDCREPYFVHLPWTRTGTPPLFRFHSM